MIDGALIISIAATDERRPLTQFELVFLTSVRLSYMDTVVMKEHGVLTRDPQGFVYVEFTPLDPEFNTPGHAMRRVLKLSEYLTVQDHRNDVKVPSLTDSKPDGSFTLKMGTPLLSNMSWATDERGMPCEVREPLP